MARIFAPDVDGFDDVVDEHDEVTVERTYTEDGSVILHVTDSETGSTASALLTGDDVERLIEALSEVRDISFGE